MGVLFPQPPQSIDPQIREYLLQFVNGLTLATAALAKATQSIGDPVEFRHLLRADLVGAAAKRRVKQGGWVVYTLDDANRPQLAYADGSRGAESGTGRWCRRPSAGLRLGRWGDQRYRREILLEVRRIGGQQRDAFELGDRAD